MHLLTETLTIALTAAPWLLFGLLAAGLIKAFIPEQTLQRWVGGRGLANTARAAVIGAPLPLCSCGAIPTAITLHRGGAGRGPTTAFMIGTPGVGADSVAITYALLGPFMAVARVAGAIITAITTGLLVATTDRQQTTVADEGAAGCGGCCGNPSWNDAVAAKPTAANRLRQGMHYAFTDLLNDIGLWILIGLVVAGILVTLVPPELMATYGTGLGAMVLMAVIGIPLYVCATAATPVAAGMLLAGVSPGTALVFLLAGPMTSMATLAVFRREMGNRALAIYLGSIVTSTLALGLLTDVLVNSFGVNITAQLGAGGELLPEWLEWLALLILVALSLPWLRPTYWQAGSGPEPQRQNRH